MKETKRKLSSEEEKRKERFEKICEDMKKSGYEKHDLTVSILQANIIAFIIMLPFVMFFGYLYFRINSTVNFVITIYSAFMFFLVLIILGDLCKQTFLFYIFWCDMEISYAILYMWWTIEKMGIYHRCCDANINFRFWNSNKFNFLKFPTVVFIIIDYDIWWWGRFSHYYENYPT